MAAGSVVIKHEAEDTPGEEKEEEGNTSGNNALVEVKLEKEEELGLLVTCGIHKRKRLSRGGRSRRYSDSSFEEKPLIILPRNKQPRVLTTRWNNER